jgi:hypothetical protein
MLLSVGMVSRQRTLLEPHMGESVALPARVGSDRSRWDGQGHVRANVAMGKRQAYRPAAAAWSGEMPGVNSPTPAPAVLTWLWWISWSIRIEMKELEPPHVDDDGAARA